MTDNRPASELHAHVAEFQSATQFDAGRMEILKDLAQSPSNAHIFEDPEYFIGMSDADFKRQVGYLKWRKAMDDAALKEKTPTDNRFPKNVNLYPVMAIAAARRASRVGGGYRLHVLAKALDRSGLGNVSRDELRDYALSLGVSVRQWSRWIEEARNADLVKDWQRQTGEWMLALPSAGKAAHSMNCESVGSRKVTMAARDLIGKGWKARIWAAYEATHNGRPISRERMQKIVNVPVSTQRYRDAQAGVTRQRNYAKLNFRADMLPMLREYGKHKGLYIRKDGFLGSRKPDSRSTDIALRAGKGRARKANKALHRMQLLNGLSLMRQSFSEDVTPETATNQSAFVRLFHSTPKRAEAIDKKMDRDDKRRDFDLFVFSHTSGNGSTVWKQC